MPAKIIAMRKLKIASILLAMLYALLCTGMYLGQERIIFDPHFLPEDYDFRTGREVEIEVEEDLSLNCIWIKEPPSRGVILYLHGNRGSIRRCLRQTRGMRGHGYDIFMPDYRGFGKSDGEITSEADLHRDAQKIYDFLKRHYPEDRIVLLGYSLGTAMASRLAAQNNPQQLVLVAPFLSMIDLKNHWTPFVPDFLVKYPFRNDRWIPKVQLPITVFHGMEDELIPYESAGKIQALNRSLVTLKPLPGEGHRGALFNGAFRRGMESILE